MELYTTIIRDGLTYDVTVSFSAECVSPGYPATRTDPGCGAEIECTFEDADLLAADDTHVLTEAELQRLREWFAANHDKAVEAAEGCFEREPANDNFWRGLEA